MITARILFVALLSFSTSAFAQSPGNPPPADAFSQARPKDDFEGMRIAFPVTIIAKLRYSPDKTVCIPAYTPLRAMSDLTADGLLVRLREMPKNTQPSYSCKGHQAMTADLVAAFDEPLIVSNADMNALPANVSGLTYGLLVVPFKYHVTGSKEFKGSGSVGPYAGYKLESGSWGASLELVGFMGLTSVTADRTIDGKTSSDSLSGLSLGGAVIGRIRDNFQVGLVLGADRVGKNSAYADNGKLWIAVSIGYAFSK